MSDNLVHYRKMLAMNIRGRQATIQSLRDVKAWINQTSTPAMLAAHLHYRASLQKSMRERKRDIAKYSGLIELENAKLCKSNNCDGVST